MKLRGLILAGVFGAQAVLASGVSVTVTSGIPGSAYYTGAPFNNFGTYSSRVEGRIDNIPAGTWQTACVGGAFCVNGTGTTIGATINFSGDTYVNPGNPIGVAIATVPGSSILYRIQRDLAKANCADAAAGCWTLEVWTIPGNGYAFATQYLTAANSNWARSGYNNTSLNTFAGLSIGWLEWYTGVVKMGQGTAYCGASPTGPCVPDATDAETGDLGSWKFEGNLSDSSGRGYNLSGGMVTYSATPIYPPICNPGAQQAFQAGVPGRLAGYGLPMDGVTRIANLVWQQLAGPPVLWTNQRSGSPTVDGLIATNVPGGPASYVFQLTCTDSSGSAAVAPVKDGAVAADANGVVVTNNGAIDGIVRQQLRSGAAAQPWPWYDDRAMYMANSLLANEAGLKNCRSTDPTACYFQPWWTYFGTGTVSFTNGSAVVTGIGTNFLEAFNCTAGGSPPVETHVAIEYMGGPGGVLPATPHYEGFFVLSCTDASHIVLNQPWYAFRGTPTGRWAADTTGQANQWSLNSNAQFPANFYDNGLGLFAMFLRTGIDDFYNAFHVLETEWWTQPSMDQGACFAGLFIGSGEGSSVCQGNAFRAWSELGIWLLGVVRGDQKCADAGCTTGTGVWPGLRYMYDYAAYLFLNLVYGVGKVADREWGHAINVMAICAANDPAWRDSYRRMTCQQILDAALQPTYSQYYADPSTGALLDGPYCSYVSASTMLPDTSRQSWGNGWGTSISLTNGSAGVTCGDGTSGGSCGWLPGTYGSGGGLGTFLWVMNDPFSPYVPTAAGANWNGGLPQNFQQGDHALYTVASIADAHHLTLTAPYSGTSGNHLYAITAGNCPLPIGPGYYVQPYMEGTNGGSWFFVGDTLASLGDSNAAAAYALGQSASTFLRNYAMDPNSKGVWYTTNSLSCPSGASTYGNNCQNGASVDGARILNIETSSAGNAEYRYNQNPLTKQFVDSLMNSFWARPGTCAGDPACSPDGFYGACLDTVTPADGGPYCATWGGGYAPWKWFGQFFGSSMGLSWAATRSGGLQSSPEQTVYVPFRLASVLGAVKVVAVRMGTDGAEAATECTASPCAISVARADNVQGVQVTLEYVDGSGTVLARSSTPVLVR